MIVCKDFQGWGGRFGNQILVVNNVAQISHYFGHDFFCRKFNGSEIFKLHEKLKNPNETINVDEELSIDFLVKNNKEEIVLHKNKNYLVGHGTLEFFFKYDSLSTFELFEYKEEYSNNAISKLEKLSGENKSNVSIHFRGTDFHSWDSKSILSFDYYKKSIDDILENHGNDFCFYLFTDDFSLPSFKSTVRYLGELGIDLTINEKSNWQEDLIMMAYSDFIISSPSTFCMVAGFTGKKEKKIIHSKDWVDNYRAKTDYFRDIFWVKLLENRGNENYSLYKTI